MQITTIVSQIEKYKDCWTDISPTDANECTVGGGLLERLGSDTEAEEESEVVFGLLDLKVADSRRIVDRLHERYGIAPLAGRFRYVSPRLLADHLAARQLSSWTRNQMVRFVGGLSAPMIETFARRMRALAAVLPNRATVEEVILGYQGPFRGLGSRERPPEHSDCHSAAPFRRPP